MLYKESFKDGSKYKAIPFLTYKKAFLSLLDWPQEILKMLFNTWSAKHSTCAFGKNKENHGLLQWWISKDKYWQSLSLLFMVFSREINLIFMEQCKQNKQKHFSIYTSALYERNIFHKKYKQANSKHWCKLVQESTDLWRLNMKRWLKKSQRRNNLRNKRLNKNKEFLRNSQKNKRRNKRKPN